MTDRTPSATTEVAPGIWSIAVPFPNPLGYTICYAIQVDKGVVLVDLGWDSDEGWDALNRGLAVANTRVDEVLGAVITHVHPDHYGLAARLKASSDAWLAVHVAERSHIAGDESAKDDYLDQMADWLRDCGCPPSEIAGLDMDASDIRSRIATVWPDFDLVDDDVVANTAGTLKVVHTPGHTPGHLCIVDEGRKLAFTGDHVLPRVTPNVSYRPDTDPDPLADYEASLRRLRPYGSYQVLPAHEWSFDGLGTRIDTLLEHHRARLNEVETAVAGGARTVWEVAQSVTWHRDFSTLNYRARRAALGETNSHLIRLSSLGRVVDGFGVPRSWSMRIGE
jgi:glyoxylase-like metal-dependent hydrolase (beta-lactamase superfamily II)